MAVSTHNIASADEYRTHFDMLAGRKTDLLNSVKQAEARLTEIATLRNAKISYAKYKPLYDAYRKSGCNKKFLQTHSEEIRIFRVAKEVFDTHKDEKIPSVKELNAMFTEALTLKKEYYLQHKSNEDSCFRSVISFRRTPGISSIPHVWGNTADFLQDHTPVLPLFEKTSLHQRFALPAAGSG